MGRSCRCAACATAGRPHAGGLRSTWPARTATRIPSCPPAASLAPPRTPWTAPATFISPALTSDPTAAGLTQDPLRRQPPTDFRRRPLSRPATPPGSERWPELSGEDLGQFLPEFLCLLDGERRELWKPWRLDSDGFCASPLLVLGVLGASGSQDDGLDGCHRDHLPAQGRRPALRHPGSFCPAAEGLTSGCLRGADWQALPPHAPHGCPPGCRSERLPGAGPVGAV